MTLRVVRGDEVLWQQDEPDGVPVVGELRAEITDQGLELGWGVQGHDEDQLHLRRSADGGRTWRLLELRARGDRTTIPLDVLPPGRQLVQAVASDGFHTTVSDPVEIDVPARAPSATIHWPLATATVTRSAPLRLWGSGMSAAEELLDDAAHAWSIDGRPVATGRDVWVEPPDTEGEHVAELVVRDGHGEHRVRNRFWVTSDGRALHRIR